MTYTDTTYDTLFASDVDANGVHTPHTTIPGMTAYTPVGAHVANPTISSVTVINKPAGANQIIIQALTQNVRFTLDNTNPTASGVGFQILAGNAPVIIAVTGTKITVIQEAATASLQYQWIS